LDAASRAGLLVSLENRLIIANVFSLGEFTMKRHYLFATVTVALLSGLFLSEAKADKSKDSKDSSEIKLVKDQRAMDELKRMGTTLSQAKSMSFHASSMTPFRGPNKQWLHVFAIADVSMQRPSQLFVETSGDSFPSKIYYDGQNFSVSSKEQNLYTQNKQTGPIDSMLGEVADKAGAAFPFADVLVSDPYSSWEKDLLGAVYVGISERGNEKLVHLALTAKDVDWEVWVDQKTHLPRMVYVKYLTEERSPSVLIELSKWKLNSKIPDTVFAFKAPKGAKMAEMKAPERMTK
jgi:hypothetical protein